MVISSSSVPRRAGLWNLRTGKLIRPLSQEEIEEMRAEAEYIAALHEEEDVD